MKDIRLCDDGKIEEVSKLCIQNNLGIEIQAFADPYFEEQRKVSGVDIVKEHREILKNISICKSLHAPFWELNLGTKMKGIRKETIDMFNYAYIKAKQLECTEIVVHNGYIPGTSGYDGWVKRATEFWKEFFADKDDSITMCIENQFESDSEIIIKEIDAVNDSRLKACLDIGHANANSNQAIEEWITNLSNRIGYLHLHNNHGKQNIKDHNNDEHLSITNGTINIVEMLKLAEQYCPNAIWSIESQTQNQNEDIIYLRDNGFLV
jgi:sugar phosphate isomerase/epimerase